MSFLRTKQRRKFNVELIVLSLSDVPLLNAIIFAKVRLLECGSFEGFTSHCPVVSYKVDFMADSPTDVISGSSSIAANTGSINGMELTELTERIGDLSVDGETASAAVGELSSKTNDNPQPFNFQCRIPTDEGTGELAKCRCKISLRKEDRVGRAPQKLGFVVLNLSEFAVWGSTGVQKSVLLEGYTGQRQDNSRVNFHVKVVHQGPDPLFKVPNATANLTSDETQLNPLERKAPPATVCEVAGIPSEKSCTLENSAKIFADAQHAHHLFPYQPNANHFHHYYDDRPISCTQFPSAGGDGNAGAELRSSWHGGSATAGGVARHHHHVVVESHSLGRGATSGGGGLNGFAGAMGGASEARRADGTLPPLLHISASPSVTNSMGGGSLADRIQKTRRDASGVIDEVLAETSALLAVGSTSSTSALSWDGIGDGVDGGFGTENENEATTSGDDNATTQFVRVRQHRLPAALDMEMAPIGADERNRQWQASAFIVDASSSNAPARRATISAVVTSHHEESDVERNENSAAMAECSACQQMRHGMSRCPAHVKHRIGAKAGAELRKFSLNQTSSPAV